MTQTRNVTGAATSFEQLSLLGFPVAMVASQASVASSLESSLFHSSPFQPVATLGNPWSIGALQK